MTTCVHSHAQVQHMDTQNAFSLPLVLTFAPPADFLSAPITAPVSWGVSL